MKYHILFALSVTALLLSNTACGAARPGVTPGPTSAPLAGELPGPKIQEIKKRGTLIVSVKKEESPTGQHRDVAHFMKRDFEISLVKAIARRLLGDENKIELKQFPLADRVPAVERTEVDLAISTISITDELKKTVDLSDPYAWESLTLMTKKGAGVRGLEDLNGQIVAAMTEGKDYFGDDLEKIAKARGLAVTAKSYNSFEEAASAVKSGQMPAMVERSINISVYMSQNPGVFEAVGGFLTRQDYAIAIKKGNDDLLKLVDSVIADLEKSGELKRLAEDAKFPIEHIGQAPATVPSLAPTTKPSTTPTPAPTGSGTGAGTGGGSGTGGGVGGGR